MPEFNTFTYEELRLLEEIETAFEANDPARYLIGWFALDQVHPTSVAYLDPGEGKERMYSPFEDLPIRDETQVKKLGALRSYKTSDRDQP